LNNNNNNNNSGINNKKQVNKKLFDIYTIFPGLYEEEFISEKKGGSD
jgi:hypothetical protein